MQTAKILVKFATRGRVERFFDGMQNIFSNCANPDFIRVVVTADNNDTEMNTLEVKERIAKYGKNVLVFYGESNNKIHATNRDLDKLPDDFNDWSIICNFSDDMAWTIYGWDELIRNDFKSFSPDYSHYMAYLDPDTHGALSTLFICGRAWFDKFGFIYDEQFQSLFCDNLVEDCAKHLGKYHYTGYSIYQHFNPSYGYKRFEPDALYLYQQKVGWDLDQKLYFKIISDGIENYLLSLK